jgi:hypothetical protein
MGARRYGPLMAVAASLALLASCGYSPDFADDTLACGERGVCPKGYACGGNNKCQKSGAGSTGVGGSNSGGGSGGSTGADGGVDGGVDPRLDNFIGTWRFTSGSVTGSCSDGSTLNGQLGSDVFIVVTRGGVGGLQLQYHCASGWNMRLPLATNTAVAIAGQTCREVTTSGGVNTTFNWAAPALTFTTSNGQAATTSGHLAGPFMDSMGVTGTCDLMFNGSLTKG